jgi:hypothetical protein
MSFVRFMTQGIEITVKCWKMQVLLQNSIREWHVTIHFASILVQFHYAAAGCALQNWLQCCTFKAAKHTSGGLTSPSS